MSKATSITNDKPESCEVPRQKGRKIKGRLLSEVAYEKIKEANIVNELAPGQEVSESQLAERFAMGKAPLRRALASLTQEGLVQPQNRRGYIIAPLTMKDIHDIWAMRLLLETEAAAITREHLESSRESVLDAVMKSPALMQVNLVPEV